MEELVFKAVMAVTQAFVITLVFTIENIRFAKRLSRRLTHGPILYVLDEAGRLKEAPLSSIPEDLRGKLLEILNEKAREADKKWLRQLVSSPTPLSRRAIITQAIILFTVLSIVSFILYAYVFKW
ncbi:hypothetical protein IMZ38_01255 [Thermosphaera chiliense]|uniref:Uncharacterized protein n=1 Tax=Thermosphaera chiliense TaxID=3402707 RepID=A0A7M1UUE0_9CREN|nr:hypothetical protein [Thermosphaera aggregans]QOR94594.1 hypothetical protein IMZ38_01255 [Thermosphaera aggregans]